MAKPNPIGATFAERKAAAEGKKTFTDPTPQAEEGEDNSTFASRSKVAKKAAAKAVDSDATEDKAVKSADSKAAKKV